MNECNKLALIRSGDQVTYISEMGHRVTRTVEGWKTTYGERLLLLEGGVHCRVGQVVERQRPGGCGAGTIKFEEEKSA